MGERNSQEPRDLLLQRSADRPRGIRRAQKTIYFEGRKLHYWAERAPSNDFL